MKPTRARTLVLIIVLTAAVTWALLTAVYSKLPPLTWTGVPALLLAAAAEAWTGRDLRARIAGRPGSKPAPPLFVARMVALAKAVRWWPRCSPACPRGLSCTFPGCWTRPPRAAT